MSIWDYSKGPSWKRSRESQKKSTDKSGSWVAHTGPGGQWESSYSGRKDRSEEDLFSLLSKRRVHSRQEPRVTGQLQVRRRLREAVDSLQARGGKDPTWAEVTEALVCDSRAERPAPDQEAESTNYGKGAECLLVAGETRPPALGERAETAALGLGAEIPNHTAKEGNPYLGLGARNGEGAPAPVGEQAG
ncbi:hypothetical protein JTB14_031625 [Gonioctena quinquepunctata]|nr:hypothetical protein JTB14_031625 [Gonioctena quinquepunctata]